MAVAAASNDSTYHDWDEAWNTLTFSPATQSRTFKKPSVQTSNLPQSEQEPSTCSLSTPHESSITSGPNSAESGVEPVANPSQMSELADFDADAYFSGQMRTVVDLPRERQEVLANAPASAPIPQPGNGQGKRLGKPGARRFSTGTRMHPKSHMQAYAQLNNQINSMTSSNGAGVANTQAQVPVNRRHSGGYNQINHYDVNYPMYPVAYPQEQWSSTNPYVVPQYNQHYFHPHVQQYPQYQAFHPHAQHPQPQQDQSYMSQLTAYHEFLKYYTALAQGQQPPVPMVPGMGWEYAQYGTYPQMGMQVAYPEYWNGQRQQHRKPYTKKQQRAKEAVTVTAPPAPAESQKQKDDKAKPVEAAKVGIKLTDAKPGTTTNASTKSDEAKDKVTTSESLVDSTDDANISGTDSKQSDSADQSSTGKSNKDNNGAARRKSKNKYNRRRHLKSTKTDGKDDSKKSSSAQKTGAKEAESKKDTKTNTHKSASEKSYKLDKKPKGNAVSPKTPKSVKSDVVKTVTVMDGNSNAIAAV